MTKKTLILLAVILCSNYLYAQPRNYWSVSFNSEASLLAGAVVGGNSDITSIFYNPAGIAEIEDKKFAINANLFDLSLTSYKNALGTDLNLEYLGFTVQPRFISFMFKVPKVERLVWQFAIFNRNEKRVSIYDQIEKTVNLIHPTIDENYVGNYDFVNDYLDSWGGVGAAYKVSDNFTIGGSLLFSLKNFSYMNLINVNVYPEQSSIPDTVNYYSASSLNYDKTVMYDVRVLGKVGVRYEQNQFSLGLNLTLPSIRFMGNADVKRTISNSGIFEIGGAFEDEYFNEAAKYLKAGFNDPISLSFGFVYKSLNDKHKYYFSTEYFHGIDTYKAIDGTQVDDDEYMPATNFLSYKYGTKPIINFAVGYQYHTSKSVELLCGFRTNFDPYSVSSEGIYEYMSEFTNVSTDLYHLTGGSKFNYKKLSVIVGLEYTTGVNRGLPEFVNFAEPEIRLGESLVLAGDNNNNMTYIYNSVGLYFGFTLGF